MRALSSRRMNVERIARDVTFWRQTARHMPAPAALISESICEVICAPNQIKSRLASTADNAQIYAHTTAHTPALTNRSVLEHYATRPRLCDAPTNTALRISRIISHHTLPNLNATCVHYTCVTMRRCVCECVRIVSLEQFLPQKASVAKRLRSIGGAQ